MTRYWKIYEDELYMLGHGLPIWKAEPFSPRHEVQIGDVGYMDEGRFRRIFNVFYGDTRTEGNAATPATSSNREPYVPGTYEAPWPNNYGVPFGHEALLVPAYEFERDEYLQKGPHSMKHCKVSEVRSHANMDPLPLFEPGATLAFTSERQTGAALVLRSEGESIKGPLDRLKTYCESRWELWRDFSQRCDALYRNPHGLMFVYGHTKTTAWTSIAAERSSIRGSISLDVDVPAIGAGGLEFTHSTSTSMSPHVNHGPWAIGSSASTTSVDNPNQAASQLKRNQTVFIRRLMSADRPLLARLQSKLAYLTRGATSTPQISDAESSRRKPPNRQRYQPYPTTYQSQCRTLKYSPTIAKLAASDDHLALPGQQDMDDNDGGIDPLELLSLYLLETEPTADRTTVSDDDVSDLLKIYASAHAEPPLTMAKLIHEVRPNTFTDFAGTARLGSLSTGVVFKLAKILSTIRSSHADLRPGRPRSRAGMVRSANSSRLRAPHSQTRKRPSPTQEHMLGT